MRADRLFVVACLQDSKQPNIARHLHRTSPDVERPKDRPAAGASHSQLSGISWTDPSPQHMHAGVAARGQARGILQHDGAGDAVSHTVMLPRFEIPELQITTQASHNPYL